MENENVNIDLIRSHVDTIILSSIFDEDKYGLEILNFIKEKSDDLYSLKQPTLYSCLKRLEKLGMVSSYKGDTSNGAQRVYYKLEQSGRDLVLKDRYQWEFSRTIINNLLSDKPFDSNEQEPPFNPSEFRPLTKRQPQLTKLSIDNDTSNIDYSQSSNNYYANSDSNADNNDDYGSYSNPDLSKPEYTDNNDNYRSYSNSDLSKTRHADNNDDYKSYSNPDLGKTAYTDDNIDNNYTTNYTENKATNTTLNNLSQQGSDNSLSNTNTSTNSLYINNQNYDADEAWKNTTTPNKDTFLLHNHSSQTYNSNNSYVAPSNSSNNIDNYTIEKVQSNHLQMTNISPEHNPNTNQSNTQSINYISSFGAIYNNQPKFQSSMTTNNTTTNYIHENEHLSLSELKNKMLSQGINLKPYLKNNTSNYYTNKYYYKNKVSLFTSLIFYAIVLVQILSIHFTISKQLGTPNSLIWVGITIPFAYPLWSLINYISKPNLKIATKLNIKSIIITTLIILIQLIILISILAFIIFDANFDNKETLIRPLIIPFSMLINIPISIIVYVLFYYSKKFNVN